MAASQVEFSADILKIANNIRDLYCSKQRAKDILKIATNIRDLI